MIKAAADIGKGGTMMIFGLSRANIERLQEGKPIAIDLKKDLGLPFGHVLIFAGETEQTMQAKLAGLIGPDTRVTGGMKQ